MVKFAFDVDAGSNSNATWTCICAANALPKVAADGHDPNCFTACNCTYGTYSLSLSLLHTHTHISQPNHFT